VVACPKRAGKPRVLGVVEDRAVARPSHPMPMGCLGILDAHVVLMRVLTIYAHHNPRSFCHAILTRFTDGLIDAGHTSEVVDLHAIGFDPVLTERDAPDWIDDSVPDDVLTHMHVKDSMLEATNDHPLRRLMLKRWMRGKDERGMVRAIHAKGAPRDVQIQQEKVSAADALAFVAPVYFVGFPAILKGWIERVFSLDFAFALEPEAWRGDIRGRMPLLKHEKALIMSTTIFDERSYEAELGSAMKTLIDDFALRYPGIRSVEHVYFYAVYGADDETRRRYLDRAYSLGRDFAVTERAASSSAALDSSV
jgi:NAD(P)H dehydrogenase (quinone)